MSMNLTYSEIFTADYIEPDWEKFCPIDPEGAVAREDNIWMISAGVLVISMNAAFGLLEAGTCRQSNTLNIMMKNVCDMVAGGLAWWVIGYHISFPSIDGSTVP